MVGSAEQLLNKVEYIFEWCFGGENVEIMAEFNNWKGEKMQMLPTNGENINVGTGLTQMNMYSGQNRTTHCYAKLLEPKRYEYKYRVDGEWRYAPN